MNISSNVGVKINSAAVTVSNANTISSGNVSNSYDEYEQIDYSDPLLYADSSAAALGILVGNSIGQFLLDTDVMDLKDDIVSNFNKTFERKFVFGTGAYIAIKTIYSNAIKSNFSKDTLAFPDGLVLNTFVTSLYAGFWKMTTGLLSGDVTDLKTATLAFASGGFGKDFIKGVTNNLVISDITTAAYLNTFETIVMKVQPNLTTAELNGVLTAMEKNMKNNTAWNNMLKSWNPNLGKMKDYEMLRLGSGDDILDAVFKSGILKSAWDMSLGTGVDFVASVVTASITNYFKGTLDTSSFAGWYDSIDGGKNLLSSAYKTVFGIAFERLFTFAGPGGQKFGKALGTVVGASMGNFWSSAFNNDEVWCTAAGIATVAGAVGGIWAGAAFAASVSATIPVAGWIVGGAIIVGATIATGAIYLIYWLTGGGG